MLSSRICAPGFNSPARTRPSSTCSLNATTRSVSSPPLVTCFVPMRMRMPDAPAMLRAGGWISAGMISVVQIPLPVLAAIAPSDWPQRCAPSPESLMTSTMCSVSVCAGAQLGGQGRRAGGTRRQRGSFGHGRSSLVMCMRSARRCRPPAPVALSDVIPGAPGRSRARPARSRTAGQRAPPRARTRHRCRAGPARPSSRARPGARRPSPRSRWPRR